MAHCSLLIAHCSLLIAYCSLLIAYCSDSKHNQPSMLHHSILYKRLTA